MIKNYSVKALGYKRKKELRGHLSNSYNVRMREHQLLPSLVLLSVVLLHL